MKSGPRPWNKSNRLIPFVLIAKELVVSVRTVHQDYKSAIQKLKAQNKYKELLRAGSVECNKNFCALYSDGGSNASL
jgi:hypothetical protein